MASADGPAGRGPVGGPDDRARRGRTRGSRCSRTAARRWAPATRIRTARSGPATALPPRRAREDADPAPTLRRRPAAGCCSTTPSRSAAARGWSTRRDGWLVGGAVLGGLAVRDAADRAAEPAARLPTSTPPARDGLAARPARAHRALRRPVRAAVPVLHGLAPGAVRRAARHDHWQLHAHFYPPLLRCARAQVHGRLRAARRAAAGHHPRGGGRAAAATPLPTEARSAPRYDGPARTEEEDATLGRAVRRGTDARWPTSPVRSMSTRSSRSTTSLVDRPRPRPGARRAS